MLKQSSKCPCCNGEVTVEHKPAKWCDEKPRIIITHKKWQENYK